MSDPVLPFILPGCVVDGVRSLPRKLVIEAHTVNQTACCPHCQQPSQRVHSRYQRAPHDLPVSDQAVQLRLHVRRFFCDAAACPQRTLPSGCPTSCPFAPNARPA
jgi:transposase